MKTNGVKNLYGPMLYVGAKSDDLAPNTCVLLFLFFAVVFYKPQLAEFIPFLDFIFNTLRFGIAIFFFFFR